MELLQHNITELLCEIGLIPPQKSKVIPEVLRFKYLAADGSNRRFVRVTYLDKVLCLAMAPATMEGQDRDEARSTWHIGRHLQGKGLPVPEIYGWNRENGLVICEDLGDIKLFDCIRRPAKNSRKSLQEDEVSLYRQAVEVLSSLQVKGGEGFDTSWCWDTERYDQEVMVKRESMYFLEAFVRDMLKMDLTPDLMVEAKELARLADDGRDHFLHRDFQSRNLMISGGMVRVIDFQGGRLGPLGYDLASLLIDPYVSLPMTFQNDMLSYYMGIMEKTIPGDVTVFQRSYAHLALQRNLQILGAFSFLYTKRKKEFFMQFIVPSLQMLQRRMNQAPFNQFKALKKCVDSAVVLIQSNNGLTRFIHKE